MVDRVAISHAGKVSSRAIRGVRRTSLDSDGKPLDFDMFSDDIKEIMNAVQSNSHSKEATAAEELLVSPPEVVPVVLTSPNGAASRHQNLLR